MPHRSTALPTGTLAISCPLTGLSSSLEFREGGHVKGALTLDKASVGVTAVTRVTLLGGLSGNWRGVVHITCPTLGEGVVHDGGESSKHPRGLPGAGPSSVARGGAAQSPHGTQSAESVSPPPPPPLLCVDLHRLGPMRLPRLWSALHDALVYNDPSRSQGGKVSVLA